MATYFVLISQFVCLSFWIGGIAVLLVIVAPSVLQAPVIEDAGTLINNMIRRYNGLLAAFQVFLIATLYVQLLLLSESVGLKLRLALTFASLALLQTIYLRFMASPRINASHQGSAETSASPDVRNRELQRSQARALLMLTVNLFLGLCVVIVLILPL